MPTTTTFVLVPGYWLGGWAWDAVAERLRDDGFVADAITLPGLDDHSPSETTEITLDDHVAAVVAAVHRADGRVVLVGHSGAGAVVSGAVDQAHEVIDDLVFVDSGPVADGVAQAPDLPSSVRAITLPPWPELEEQGSSLDGLDADALGRFRERAVPHPAAVARQPLALSDTARRAVPVTVVCASYSAQQIREMSEAGHPWFEELAQYESVRLVDLPTGHWPMWSRPQELADELREVVARHPAGD
ncbi:alpha/beta fold hydrolase [Microbacterium sp. HJ5]